MTGNLLGDQITVSAVIVLVLQWMKKTSWFPVVQQNTDRLNRFLAVILSGLAAVGIHFQYDASIGTLTITGLTVAGMVHFGWEWLRAYAVTELTYRAGVKSVTRAKNGGQA